MSEAFDWNDLIGESETAFEPLPEGEYAMVVEKAEAVKTQKGKDMIKVVFRVEVGPHAGKTVFNNFVVSPENNKAIAFFLRHMGALGISLDYFKTNPKMTQVAHDLLGKRATVKLSIRTWEGVKQNDVKSILPPSGAPNVAMKRPSITVPGDSPGGTSMGASPAVPATPSGAGIPNFSSTKPPESAAITATATAGDSETKKPAF